MAGENVAQRSSERLAYQPRDQLPARPRGFIADPSARTSTFVTSPTSTPSSTRASSTRPTRTTASRTAPSRTRSSSRTRPRRTSVSAASSRSGTSRTVSGGTRMTCAARGEQAERHADPAAAPPRDPRRGSAAEDDERRPAHARRQRVESVRRRFDDDRGVRRRDWHRGDAPGHRCQPNTIIIPAVIANQMVINAQWRDYVKYTYGSDARGRCCRLAGRRCPRTLWGMTVLTPGTIKNTAAEGADRVLLRRVG
jgi:hypothetical protein